MHGIPAQDGQHGRTHWSWLPTTAAAETASQTEAMRKRAEELEKRRAIDPAVMFRQQTDLYSAWDEQVGRWGPRPAPRARLRLHGSGG